MRSKSDRDLKVALDVPIWSQITTSANITNRHVKYGVRATHDRSARRTLRTWVRSGVFHNTTGGISLMRDQMGHHLSENDLRLPNECKAPLVHKWSHGVAQTAYQVRMRLDPSERKPSRFPNKTPRAGLGYGSGRGLSRSGRNLCPAKPTFIYLRVASKELVTPSDPRFSGRASWKQQ